MSRPHSNHSFRLVRLENERTNGQVYVRSVGCKAITKTISLSVAPVLVSSHPFVQVLLSLSSRSLLSCRVLWTLRLAPDHRVPTWIRRCYPRHLGLSMTEAGCIVQAVLLQHCWLLKVKLPGITRFSCHAAALYRILTEFTGKTTWMYI